MIQVIMRQTKFLMKQKESIYTLIILLVFVCGNYLRNVIIFKGYDVSQMYNTMKILSLSYNRIYLNADMTLLFVMIYPILVSVPAGFSYIKEQQTKEEIFLITRIGKKLYFFIRLCSAFLATTLTFFIPFILEICMNIISFPISARGDLSNLSIYSEEYLGMINNYIGSNIYIISPILYAVIFTLFFSIMSGLLGIFAVSISMAFNIKFRALLLLPTFLLLNCTNYLNTLLKKKIHTTNWYEYMLLFSDSPKNIWYLVFVIFVVFSITISLYFYGKKREKL